MGFFTDLKEDLNQAVSELIPEEKGQDAETAKQEEISEQEPTEKQLADLEEMLQNIDELKITEESEENGQEWENAAQEEKIDESISELQGTVEALQGKLDDLKEEPETKGSNLEKELRDAFGAAEGEETVEMDAIKHGAEIMDKSWVLDLKDMETMDETAVITSGMRIKGDILSNGSVDIIGEIVGNVQLTGKLNVTGKINGNTKAEEIFADAARINGDMISDGPVKIGVGSVVIGSIEAASAVIAGAIKGNIDVKGPVILDATAVVLGNVRAKSMQINNGARIEGMCMLCYAEQSATKFFEEQVDF
ncbi:MAG: polymer-forming cytoskeletal protein [Lachnospiraceae bacterium]|nr:polymer-forming cytoskeletal protein [Lachnospiraceae bacterium]MBP5222226.1 polymer-forming cytoskeletal protein [Lachnospiraceae bacterium]